MDIPSAVIVYLAGIKLAVVGAGSMCIVLGYLLLRAGVDRLNRVDEEVKVSVKGFTMHAKNLGPGTCFALFGAGLITAMLLTASPEYVSRVVLPAVDRGSRLPPNAVKPAREIETKLRRLAPDEIRVALDDYRNGIISPTEAYEKLCKPDKIEK